MNRNIIWSFILHVVVILGGAQLAPMGGLFDATSHSMDIITVGIIDGAGAEAPAPIPKPKIDAPLPEANDAIALKPESDLTKEEVAPEEEPEPVPEEPEPEKPKPEEKPEEKPRQAELKPKDPPADTVNTQQFADASTEPGTTGSISDGTGTGDVWGVETDASVNPYHRRGFAAIRNNWRNPATGPRPLKCIVRFQIQRSGQVIDVELEQSSGSALFDRQAVRAVQMTESWDAFPRFWEEDEQIIHLEFEYRP